MATAGGVVATGKESRTFAFGRSLGARKLALRFKSKLVVEAAGGSTEPVSLFGEPTKDAPGVVTVRHGGVQRRETVCLALALDFDELFRACSALKGARSVAIAADTG